MTGFERHLVVKPSGAGPEGRMIVGLPTARAPRNRMLDEAEKAQRRRVRRRSKNGGRRAGAVVPVPDETVHSAVVAPAPHGHGITIGMDDPVREESSDQGASANRMLDDSEVVEPDREPDAASREPFLRRTGRAILDAITGEGRFEPGQEGLPEFFPDIGGLPESGLSEEQVHSIATTLQLVADEKAQRDILLKIAPELEFRDDAKGNIQIRNPSTGEFEFLNKPGASKRDLVTLVSQLIQFLPAGRVLRGVRALQRVPAVAGASGVTSLMQDVAATAAGSEQGIDGEKALLAALGGAIGEASLPQLQAFVRNLKHAGSVTRAQAEQLAAQVGLDPRAITDEFLRLINQTRFRRDAVAAAVPGRNAERAVGEVLSEQFDVPLSSAHKTRDPAQFSAEDAMTGGDRGAEAGRIVRGFRDETQIPAINRAEMRLTQQGGGGVPATRLDAAEQTGEAIRQRATELGARVDDAFNFAAAGDITITQDSARGLARRILNGLNDESRDIASNLTPRSAETLSEILELANRLPRQAQPIGFTAKLSDNPPPTLLSLREIERIRRRIDQRFRNATNEADRASLTLIKQQFDGWVDDAIDNDLFAGTPAALDRLQNARALRTVYGRLFAQRNRQDDAGRIIQRIVHEPDLSNTQISNWLFGASKIGQTDRSINVAKRLLELFGEDSPQVIAIRQANVRNIFFNPRTGEPLVAKGRTRQGLDQVIANLDEFIDGNSANYAEILHTPEQIAELAAFRELMRRFLPPERGARAKGFDPERGRDVIDGFSKLMDVFGMATGSRTASAIGAATSGGSAFRNRAQARKVVAQVLGKPPVPPTIPLGQAAGVLGSQ